MLGRIARRQGRGGAGRLACVGAVAVEATVVERLGGAGVVALEVGEGEDVPLGGGERVHEHQPPHPLCRT